MVYSVVDLFCMSIYMVIYLHTIKKGYVNKSIAPQIKASHPFMLRKQKKIYISKQNLQM